jgi:hypothetical protein
MVKKRNDERWPMCLACGQPREDHTEDEIANGCRRKAE